MFSLRVLTQAVTDSEKTGSAIIIFSFGAIILQSSFRWIA